MGRPNVYPTDVTVYYPEEAYSGYTLFVGKGHGIILLDMNGKIVRFWKDMAGFPAKMLPGGHLIGSLRTRGAAFAYQDQRKI